MAQGHPIEFSSSVAPIAPSAKRKLSSSSTRTNGSLIEQLTNNVIKSREEKLAALNRQMFREAKRREQRRLAMRQQQQLRKTSTGSDCSKELFEQHPRGLEAGEAKSSKKRKSSGFHSFKHLMLRPVSQLLGAARQRARPPPEQLTSGLQLFHSSELARSRIQVNHELEEEEDLEVFSERDLSTDGTERDLDESSEFARDDLSAGSGSLDNLTLSNKFNDYSKLNELRLLKRLSTSAKGHLTSR